jgi:hypothetical protein
VYTPATIQGAVAHYGEWLRGRSWFSEIARECAPGPQGRPNRPSSTILLVVGRRRRPIDGLSIGQTDSYVAERGGRAYGVQMTSDTWVLRGASGRRLRSDPSLWSRSTRDAGQGRKVKGCEV